MLISQPGKKRLIVFLLPGCFWRSRTNHISLKWKSVARLNTEFTHRHNFYIANSLRLLNTGKTVTGAIQTCTRVVITIIVHRPPTKMTLTARSVDGKSETVEAELEESWEAALRAQEDPPPSPHSFKRTPETEPTAQHLYTGGRSRALPKLLNHNTRHFCCFCREFTFNLLV